MFEGLEYKKLPSELSRLDRQEPSRPLDTKWEEECLVEVSMDDYCAEQPPMLLSSIYGRMNVLVFAFPTNGAYDELPYIHFLEELICQLKGKDRLFILLIKGEYLLPENKKQLLKQLAEENGSQFELVELNHQQVVLDEWIRDEFLASTREENGQRCIYLLEPGNNSWGRNVPGLFVNKINQRALIPTIQFKYHRSLIGFEGGNVLVGERFLLIGAHKTEYHNLEKYGASYFGRHIIFLETEPIKAIGRWSNARLTSDNFYNTYKGYRKNQVLYHLDLFLTLGGKKGDQELIIIGRPEIGFDLDETAPDDVKELIGELIINTRNAIDQIRANLEYQLQDIDVSIEIHEVPLPLVYYDEIKDGKKRRQWTFVSYNNSLTEIFYDDKLIDPCVVKHIVLPSYGISSDYSDIIDNATGLPCANFKNLYKYDLESQLLWKGLGFQVTVLRRDFNPFAYRCGSLHCLSNCIERS